MSDQTSEIMASIYVAIRQRNNQPTEDDVLPTVVSDYIDRLAAWYKAQTPPTDEDAALAIELLELLVKGDFDAFLDELGDMLENADPLPRLPALPAIFGDLADDDELEQDR